MSLPAQLVARLFDRVARSPLAAIPDALREHTLDPEVVAKVDEVPLRVNRFGFDPWGFSPETAKVTMSLARRLSDYFRPEITGIENVPDGRVLIVPNHSGQIPFDGVVVSVACLMQASPPRLVRAQAERWVPTLPVIGELYSRTGVVVGDPINCRNLLLEENAILVFPEGVKGSGKTWDKRYRLQPFGRGFMRLALQTNAPIVPVSVVGAEEALISIHDWRMLARLLRAPYIPISPLLPILGPLAYLPLPTKFYVRFGEPMRFTGPYDDEDPVIQAKVDEVAARVQGMIDESLAARPSIFG